MTPFPELNELIAAGWGHVRRDRIPQDWRDRKAPREPEATTQRRKAGTLEQMRQDKRTAAQRRAANASTDAVHGTSQETYLAADRAVTAKRRRIDYGSADWGRMTLEQRREFIRKRSERIKEGWAKR